MVLLDHIVQVFHAPQLAHTAAGEDARVGRDAFGRIRRGEMMRAFIISEEYRKRFGLR